MAETKLRSPEAEAGARKRRRQSDAKQSDAAAGRPKLERIPSDISESESASEEEEDSEEEPTKPSSGSHPQVRAGDVRVAKETAELFKSNVMKLQIEEVLKELTYPAQYVANANSVLHAMRKMLLAAPSIKPSKLKDLQKKLSAKIPLLSDALDLSFDQDHEYEFLPPTDVNVTGSYFLGSIAKQPGGSAIDLLVEMPEQLFHPKDYLNFRFYAKRAVYVAFIADLISRTKSLGVKASYEFDKGDCLRPIILLEFQNTKMSRHFHILVHFSVKASVFPAHKLGEGWNAIRSLGEIPTPKYNLSVLTDMCYDFIQRCLHSAKAQAPGFTDACKLGRLWLMKRGFGGRPSQGGFGSFEFSILMAALLNGGHETGKRVLLPGYSCFQLFRGALMFLARGKVGLEISSKNKTQLTSAEFSIMADELPLDFLARCPSWCHSLLVSEAQLTVQLLGDLSIDRFADIFIKNIDQPELRFDYNLDVSLGSPLQNDFRLNPDATSYTVEQLHAVINTGLKERVLFTRIAPKMDDTNWGLQADSPSTEQSLFTVSLIVNRHEAEKRVTYGPDPESDELAGFKQFWGNRSGLRRFQDGSIKEAVVWSPKTRPIVLDVLDYILSEHTTARLLPIQSIESTIYPVLDGKVFGINQMANFQAKINDFNELSQDIQGLEKLPLRVASIYSTSSSLRFTSLTEPRPTNLHCDDAIAHGIINLESSGKWPDDVVAIEKVKIALLVKVAELLRQNRKKYEVSVGVETGIVGPGIETGFLLVSTPAGYAFKLSPVVAKVETLIARAKPHSQSALAEDSLLRCCRAGPKAADHNRFVNSLALKQPLYSVTARMLKLWFKKQLLASVFTEQAIELIAMKPFVDSAPYAVPNTAAVAFRRALNFLASWNWKEEPLILSLKSEDMDAEEELAVSSDSTYQVEGCKIPLSEFTLLTSAFKKLRERDPAMTLSPLFIGSPADTTGIMWTQALPRSKTSLLMSKRLTALAKSADSLINLDQWQRIFRASLSEYDVVFKLKNPSCENKSAFKNLQSVNARDLEKNYANFGLEFYKDIAETYRESILLFYSGTLDDRQNSSQFVAGVWNRDAVGQRPFKVNTFFDFKPASESEIKLNKDSILREIKRLGGDMIELERA